MDADDDGRISKNEVLLGKKFVANNSGKREG